MSRLSDVVAIVEQIKSLLAGKPAEVQGAALADCLAIWLAGHHVKGDKDATRTMRAELLMLHFTKVCELIPVNAKITGMTP